MAFWFEMRQQWGAVRGGFTCFSLRLLLDVRPMAGRLLLALCQADESRVNVGICSLKLRHRGNTDQLRRQPRDLLIANQHLTQPLSDSHTHTQSVTYTHTGWVVTQSWHFLPFMFVLNFFEFFHFFSVLRFCPLNILFKSGSWNMRVQ